MVRATLQNDEGVAALDPNQILAVLSGRGVISGGTVGDASEPFHVQVLSAQTFFGATESDPAQTVTRSAATLDLREYVADFNPRKIVICACRTEDGNAGSGGADGNGPYEVVTGEATAIEPSDATPGRETARPPLPDLSDDSQLSAGLTTADVTPLAALWIGESAEEIQADDPQYCWDRRQSPDVEFRRVTAQRVEVLDLVDGGGRSHTGELADAADVRTDSGILGVVNDDPDHGDTADHNYRTNEEIRTAVAGTVDANQLSGAAGDDGQLLFTNGSSPYWAAPPASWGDPFDQTLDTDADAEFNSVTGTATAGDRAAVFQGPVEWSDGTTTETSPTADSGGVSVLADLGDVQRGPASARHAPSGSGDVFVAHDGGIYHDDPSADPAEWVLLAVHPAGITTADQLGFDVATQAELDTHDGTSDAHHVQPGDSDFVSAVVNADGPLDISISGDAATVGGIASENFARTDTDETFEGNVHIDGTPDDTSWLRFLVSGTRNWGISPTFSTDALTLYDYLASSPVWVAESGGPLKVRNRNVELDSGQSLTGGTVESDVPGGNVTGSVAQADNAANLGGDPPQKVAQTFSASVTESGITPSGYAQTAFSVRTGHTARVFGCTVRNPMGNVAPDVEVVLRDIDQDNNYYSDSSGGSTYRRGRTLAVIDGPADVALRIRNLDDTNDRTASAHAMFDMVEN